MSDLISKEKILKIIEDIKCDDNIPKNYGTILDIMRHIRKQPSEFNVDLVIYQLENYGKYKGILYDREDKYENYIPVSVAKQIVKAGGVGEVLRYSDMDTINELLDGKWVDSKMVQDALGLSFKECFTKFDFSRMGEWLGIVGETEEERQRNGQKISTYFRVKTQ